MIKGTLVFVIPNLKVQNPRGADKFLQRKGTLNLFTKLNKINKSLK